MQKKYANLVQRSNDAIMIDATLIDKISEHIRFTRTLALRAQQLVPAKLYFMQVEDVLVGGNGPAANYL